MQRVRFDELKWIDAPMPDGSAPIRLARLPKLPDGHFRIFGRFPPGWQRTIEGHYPAFEEILLLEGDLTVAGVTVRGGDYTWVPAREMRPRTSSEAGCLAFARFGGGAHWTRGVPASGPEEPRVNLVNVQDKPGVLHARGSESSRIVASASEVPPHEGPIEWLSLVDRTWAFTEPNEPAPDLAGPFFVRLL